MTGHKRKMNEWMSVLECVWFEWGTGRSGGGEGEARARNNGRGGGMSGVESGEGGEM